MADAEADARDSLIEQAISAVLEELDGISELKREQNEALKAFLTGKDILALLPTGFGKSLIYQLVPLVYKKLADSSLFSGVASPIVIVVSPLVALMEDQVKEASKLGVSAAQLGKDDKAILDGKVELVFGSPESWLHNKKWREMLASSRCRDNIVGIVIDEAHTTYKWGEGSKTSEAFRKSFSQLGELRSLVKEGTPVLALTASVDSKSRQRVLKLLNMQGAQTILFSPNRENIRMGVVKVPYDVCKQLVCLDWVAKMIKEKGVDTPYTIIYVRSINATGIVFHYFKHLLSDGMWVDRDPEQKAKNLLVGIYHKDTLPKYKENVVSSFSGSGNCRVVIATTALGMGINFPHVSNVILLGPAMDAETILQQVGRAGRDGAQTEAVVYYHGGYMAKVDAAVKTFVNTTGCIRKALYSNFEDTPVSVTPGHRCCTNCHKTCTCAAEGCTEQFPASESFQNTVKLPARFREVDPEDRIMVREMMHEYRSFLLANTTYLYDSSAACAGFSDQLIDCVADKCDHLFDIAYIKAHCPVFKDQHAKEILRIMYEVFEDIDEPEPSVKEPIHVPDMTFAGYFDAPDDNYEVYSELWMFDSESES
ncbi:ATP-dependent DNA helicase RecQ-like [Branchiostoma floridae x Branchiostoma japonicum]